MTHTQKTKLNKAEEYAIKLATKALNENNLYWEKGWIPNIDEQPTNFHSKRIYNGLNEFILGMTGALNGYKTNYWMTYNQVLKTLGYSKKNRYAPLLDKNGKDTGLKKSDLITGEAVPVEHWKMLYGKIKNNKLVSISRKEYYDIKNGTDLDAKDSLRSKLVFNTCHWVYNIEQTTIKPPKPKKKAEKSKSKIKRAEEVVAQYKNPPKIKIQSSNRAYYVPSKDLVVCPKFSQFKEASEFYGTLFHELIHSTGHESRCDRKEGMKNVGMGSHEYSYEELVAEIGSTMLRNYTGIECKKADKNSQAYIKGWCERIESNPKWIISSARQSVKAVRHILS